MKNKNNFLDKITKKKQLQVAVFLGHINANEHFFKNGHITISYFFDHLMNDNQCLLQQSRICLNIIPFAGLKNRMHAATQTAMNKDMIFS